jgi:hypothetical protein
MISKKEARRMLMQLVDAAAWLLETHCDCSLVGLRVRVCGRRGGGGGDSTRFTFTSACCSASSTRCCKDRGCSKSDDEDLNATIKKRSSCGR